MPTLGTTVSPRRDQPLAICAFAAAVVVVGWVLYRHYAYGHLFLRVFRWEVVAERGWLTYLVQVMLLCIPYALVLLLWGRDLGRGVAGAAVALGTGVFVWGLGEVFDHYVWQNGAEGATSMRVFVWANLLVVSVLVPLAWGVARRHGRVWWAGLVVAPLAAAVIHEWQNRSAWWTTQAVYGTGSHFWLYQALAYVAPFVLGALACWWVEARRGRRIPDTGSSA